MELSLTPTGLGWITLEIGPTPDETMDIKLSWVFDSALYLHRFFHQLVSDPNGLARATIDEEGRFVTLTADPTKNPSHARLTLRKKHEQLVFTCSRRRAADAYVQAFRELRDDDEHEGFDDRNLHVDSFELLLGYR